MKTVVWSTGQQNLIHGGGPASSHSASSGGVGPLGELCLLGSSKASELCLQLRGSQLCLVGVGGGIVQLIHLHRQGHGQAGRQAGRQEKEPGAAQVCIAQPAAARPGSPAVAANPTQPRAAPPHSPCRGPPCALPRPTGRHAAQQKGWRQGRGKELKPADATTRTGCCHTHECTCQLSAQSSPQRQRQLTADMPRLSFTRHLAESQAQATLSEKESHQPPARAASS